MTYQYQASASKDGSINPNKKTKGSVRDTYADAIRDAHAFLKGNKTVTILRADCEGINEGKFFLYCILK